jgi:hypothetical protein
VAPAKAGLLVLEAPTYQRFMALVLWAEKKIGRRAETMSSSWALKWAGGFRYTSGVYLGNLSQHNTKKKLYKRKVAVYAERSCISGQEVLLAELGLVD